MTQQKPTDDKRKSELSRAASIMRNPSSTPEERRQAAAMLGRIGGQHSHDNDPGRKQSSRNRQEAREMEPA